MRIHVFPKSCVRYTHGVMSPKLCRSNAAYAVPGSKRLASTHETQLAFGKPETFPATLVQCPPPSRVSWTLPSSVPTQMVFASRGDSLITVMVVWAAAVGGVAHPGTVVLQPAVDVVGVRSVESHVIELRDRKVLLLPPPVPAVEGLPEPAVVAADDVLRILRVDPEIVPVAVRSSAGVGEAATPVLADDQVEVRLEEAVGIGGIDDQPREVEGPPDHGLTAIERSPLGAAVVGAVERGMLGFDERVDALR